MTSDNLAKLFWYVKNVIDDHSHYVSAKERRHLHHTLAVLATLADIERVAEESRYYRSCHACQMEIDLRNKASFKFNEHGDIVHTHCPKLRQTFT